MRDSGDEEKLRWDEGGLKSSFKIVKKKDSQKSNYPHFTKFGKMLFEVLH